MRKIMRIIMRIVITNDNDDNNNNDDGNNNNNDNNTYYNDDDVNNNNRWTIHSEAHPHTHTPKKVINARVWHILFINFNTFISALLIKFCTKCVYKGVRSSVLECMISL